MSIRKRILKNGRSVYDVTIYIDDGKRRTKTVPTKAAAVALESSWIAEKYALSARDGSLTLKAYIYNVYWPVAAKRLAATSLDTYDQEIKLRIIPALGKIPLRDIDRTAIQKLMVDSCKTDCVAKKCIGVLKTILNEAIHDGYISKNYASGNFALPKTPARQRDNGLVLSSFEEIRDMLQIVNSGSLCVQRIAYTGLLLGLRPEERYALTWSCFDMGSNTVTISEARVTASAKHGGVQTKGTKTKMSTRTIPMHDDFFSWLESQPRGHGAFIPGIDGDKISPSTARKRWSRFLGEHPECPPITIENMRHSFATAYLAAGGRIEVLSRILGHTNISTTINRYYRPDVNLLRADLDLVAQNSRILSAHQGLTGVRFSAPPPL